VALLLALPALSACAGRAQPLEPLVVGWERIFRLEWKVAHRGDQQVVSGYLINDSPYTVMRVQLLVEALDASGAVVGQEVTWATADMMTPSTERSSRFTYQHRRRCTGCACSRSTTRAVDSDRRRSLSR
jgi:hypothetical protein